MNDSELWTCPDCGHRFVTERMWHSCGNYDFERHFDGKEPFVLDLFNRFRELVESCGDVVCYPQKTRIVFQARMRFATCHTRKKHLLCGLILPNESPDLEQLRRIEAYGPHSFGHYFKIERLEDFDDRFAEMVRIAHKAGI